MLRRVVLGPQPPAPIEPTAPTSRIPEPRTPELPTPAADLEAWGSGRARYAGHRARVATRHPKHPDARATRLGARRGARAWSRLGALIIVSDVTAVALTTAFSRSPWWCLLMGVAVVVAIRHSGMQRRRLAPRLLDDLPTLLALILVGLGLVLLLRGILQHTQGTNSVRDASHLTVALLGFRLALYTALRSARVRGHALHDTLIVGYGRLGRVLGQALLNDRRYGLRPVGYVSREGTLGDPAEAELPRLGVASDAAELVRRHRIEAVVIADGSDIADASDERLTALTRSLDGTGVAIHLVPRLWELHGSAQGAEMVGGIPLIRLQRPAYEAMTWPLKRLLDVAVASIGLLLLSPLMLVVAVFVRRELGPGVVFRQQRVGRNGRVFEVLKFRSVRLDAPGADASDVCWSVAGDARVGRVGRWIRRLSLDELPQLLNVLRGDMSLVGPRPERPHFVARFTSEFGEYASRHRVPCGLTGWAQIHGLRGDTSIATRARYDNYYIENWSLWLDVKILLRTVRHVVTGAGL